MNRLQMDQYHTKNHAFKNNSKNAFNNDKIS